MRSAPKPRLKTREELGLPPDRAKLRKDRVELVNSVINLIQARGGWATSVAGMTPITWQARERDGDAIMANLNVSGFPTVRIGESERNVGAASAEIIKVKT